MKLKLGFLVALGVINWIREEIKIERGRRRLLAMRRKYDPVFRDIEDFCGR